MTAKKSSVTTGGDKVLPPSGLVEDVLPGLNPRGESADTRDGRSIYQFADSMQQTVEDPETVSRRQGVLETWVTFRLSGETFALPVSHVREILRVTTITRVPDAPDSVRGVTNMRGSVLPVIDLRMRLGLPETPLADTSRILVVSSRRRLLGLLVDSVKQVARIDLNQVQQPPGDVMTARSEYIIGVSQLDEELVIMLDVDRVLMVRAGESSGRGEDAS